MSVSVDGLVQMPVRAGTFSNLLQVKQKPEKACALTGLKSYLSWAIARNTSLNRA